MTRTRRKRSLYACGAVFDRQTSFRRHAHRGGREQVKIRRGLRKGDHVGAEDLSCYSILETRTTNRIADTCMEAVRDDRERQIDRFERSLDPRNWLHRLCDYRVRLDTDFLKRSVGSAIPNRFSATSRWPTN